MRLVACALLAAGLAAQPRVDFAREVWPIFTQHCTECHRAAWTDAKGKTRTAKAGLRLDGKDWILRGGDTGRILTPGKPEQSELQARIDLPEDDPDRMPEDKPPLAQAERETIRRWIQEGADFGTWTGAEGGAASATAQDAPLGARASLYTQLAQGLAAAPLPRFERATVVPVLPGSALLRVGFAGQQDAVRDADLDALLPLVDRIAHLDLARTRITDKAARVVASMPRLVHLDLRETAVGDAFVRALANAGELRVLNLYGTKIGDAGLEVLPRLGKLESLHLGGTACTETALAALQERLPKTRITGAAALPSQPADDGQPARGRRRGK